MRMGCVRIELEYVVDLDNADMIAQAREALYEDVMNAVKYNELSDMIAVEENKNLDPELIPSFLLEDENV